MTQDTSNDKIRQLCQTLEKEALGPAQQKVDLLLQKARSQADDILRQARANAKAELEQNRALIDQERKLFDASLRQAAKLAKQALRNDFENRLFLPNLEQLLTTSLADPVVMTRLIRSIIDAIEREGLSCDLSVAVAKSTDIETLNALLGQTILNKLREGTCLLANIGSGVRVSLCDRGITFDLSDQFLGEILQKNLQSSFAKTFFQQSPSQIEN